VARAQVPADAAASLLLDFSGVIHDAHVRKHRLYGAPTAAPLHPLNKLPRLT